MRGRKPSPWSEEVRLKLIQRCMTQNDLAQAIGRSVSYTCAIVNERVVSVEAIKAINEALDIETPNMYLS